MKAMELLLDAHRNAPLWQVHRFIRNLLPDVAHWRLQH